MFDGSGLAASDRLDAATLTGVLRLAVTTPRLHPLLAGLPVAGWSGTLDNRYLSGTAASAAGDVRAKTGTLTAVSTLAGVVHTRSGRLLVFAFLADRVPPSYAGTTAADAALDRVAAALASCGCN
jgi:D-alanyl-D-alanine carboxypeptidase/D-alanyl-D-alanine-endopeptidase (penicillin-binding protein 4)